MSGMRFELSPQLAQKQIIAPRMFQSMEILQLPIMALTEKLQTELQENPFLELKENRAKDEETGEEAEFNPDAPLKHDETGDLEFARMEEINRDWEDHFNEDHRPSRASIDELGDKKLEAMQNLASAPQSLQDHLKDQLSYLDLEPLQYELVNYILSHLDDNGYLLAHDPDSRKLIPIRLEDLAQTYSATQGQDLPLQEFEDALDVVQSLDPAGVGARDTKECLLLQIPDDSPHRDLLRALIIHHLEDVAHNRLPLIQKKTGADIPVIQDAIEALRHLDPKPGARFMPESTQYVVPDIIVSRTDDDDFDIRLVNDWVPNVRVSKRNVELMKDVFRDKNYDPKAREEMQKRLRSAHWIVDAIQQRRNTLIKVTRAIITHQRAFLDRGPEFIQPLKMEDIAKQVGVHVTTISRAVDDKWVETPRGVFPLKRFFGGGTKNNQTGEDVAWEKIKQKLLEIIASEDKAKPMSDEEIVEKFEADGLKVARRTVTKYREALKIPSSRQRKDWSRVE